MSPAPTAAPPPRPASTSSPRRCRSTKAARCRRSACGRGAGPAHGRSHTRRGCRRRRGASRAGSGPRPSAREAAAVRHAAVRASHALLQSQSVEPGKRHTGRLPWLDRAQGSRHRRRRGHARPHGPSTARARPTSRSAGRTLVARVRIGAPARAGGLRGLGGRATPSASPRRSTRRRCARELVKPLWIVPQYPEPLRERLVHVSATAARRRCRGARSDAGGSGAARPLSLDRPALRNAAGDLGVRAQGRSRRTCDYALGLVDRARARGASTRRAGEPGIRMAYFNLREGRFRQSNLHLVKPARLGNRHYIEDMYEHRYQRQLGQALGLAWRIFSERGGGVRVLFYYGLMHLAGVLDRQGLASRGRSGAALADPIAARRARLRRAAARRASASWSRGSAAARSTSTTSTISTWRVSASRSGSASWRVSRRRSRARSRCRPRRAAGTAPCGVLPPGPQA